MESVKVKAKSKKKSKRTQKRQEARVEDVRNEIDSEISISGSVASEVSASSSSYNDPEVKPEPSTSQVSVEDLSIEESPNKEISLPLPRMHSVEPQILDQVNTTDADKTMEKKLTAEDDLTFSNESAVEKCVEPSESDVNAPCHDAHLDLSNQVQIIELESDETSEVAPSTAVANKCEVIPDKNLVSNAAVLFHEDRSMVMPSAPCEENSSVVQSLTALESNENTVDCSIPTENLSRLYPDIQHEAETTDYMLPYTESQLVYIYHNQILDSNEEFVDDFIEAQHGLESHEFYQLLISYRQARSNFNCAKLSLETISEDYKRARDCCWSFHEEEISKQDKCGDGKTVKGSCVFRISNLNGESVHQVINCLKCNRDILNGSFTLHNFEVEATYKRIDSYIYDLLTSVPEFMNQTFNGPVTCHGTNVHNPDVIHAVAVLKSCISVLFIFQRRQITDFKFIQDTRAWLNALVGLLLRFASFSDHLFILNHILRCPAGASKWAGCFIQPPPPPTFSLHMSLYQSVFGSNELDLCITCLANMLLPIRSRDTFLQNMLPSSHSMEVHSEKSIKEQPWTLLDSEGEEDNDPVNSCMKWQENDLVAFLSQIPFSEIFRHMLLIDSSSGIDKYDVKRGGEQNMLKLIAFSTILVRIMREGLKIYSDAKYHQFNKRLCGIIRDCVQFLADHLQNMRIVIDRSHNPLMIRISVEFNQLFLRAVSSIYSSHGSGSWQFLAELPFCSVSVDTLWRVLRMLHQVDDDEFYDPNDFHWHKKFLDPNSRLEFDEKLSKLLVLDAFHLMNTFTSMAFSRNIMDKEFIEDVSFQIFQIAFLSTHTRDSCSKEGLNHLSLIVTKHQFVISLLLEQAKNNLSHLGKMAVYLFSDIPLHHWKATENDFATLIKLIEETEVSSLENCLARTILSKLNWSFGDDGKTLFFDWSLQCRIALVIVKHCEKIESSRKHSGIISEIMNEVSEVASAINTRLDPEQAFLVWSWRMLLRLRLHVCDLSTSRHRLDEIELATSSRDVYNSPALQQLLYGVNRRHPVACYTALALTNLGHRKSDICTEGFKLLRVLVEHHLYTPTLRILSCVLPLFYESSDYLECDTFVSIISTIVFADETYWKMAKKIMANVTYFEVTKQMITPAFPGPILKQLSSMIRYDFDLIAKNSPQSARNLVKLWFRVLARIPDWNRDEKVQFVLDAIIQQVFKDISCMTSMKALFQCLFQQIKQKSSGMGASLFSFMSTQHPSLIPSASLPMCPWYAYTVLDAEEEEAINMKLWINLLQELDSNPNLSVDAALKRVSNKIGVQIPTKSLPIYRWAQQAMDTRKDHPLFTIFWLRFFVLYLQRVPSKMDSLNRKSVGQTFFKSFSDLSFLKSMKKCLTESVDHFRAESLNKSSTSGDASSEALKSEPTISSKTDLLHHKISMLLYVFLLWLEEPRLHEASLYLPSLPEQYNAQLLQIIFDGDKKICMEYVDLKSFSTELEANHWQEIIDPSDLNLSSASSRTNDDDSIETVSSRIIYRLKKYKEPLQPPAVPHAHCPVASVTFNLLQSQELKHSLLNDFRLLKDQAKQFSTRCARLLSLDAEYVECIPELYTNKEKEVRSVVPCQKNDACSMPVNIILKYKESFCNTSVWYKLENNRSEYSLIVNEVSMAPPQSFVCAAVHIQNSISFLVKMLKQCSVARNVDVETLLRDIGAELFYSTIILMDEDTRLFLPTNSFLGTCIDTLGKEFIFDQSKHCYSLMNTVVENPQIADVLSSHFNPSCVSTTTFIQMYEKLSRHITSKDSHVMFSLLTKFDFAQWLQKSSPKFSERSEIIDIIGNLLVTIGLYPDSKQQLCYDVYKNHINTMFLYQFPDHYGQFVQILLKGMSNERISEVLWLDIMKFLGANITDHTDQQMIKETCISFATGQVLLSREQIEETLTLFASHFMKERLSSATKNLYSSFRAYATPISIFLSLLCHALVHNVVSNRQSSTRCQVLEKIWMHFVAVFSPWIQPIDSDRHEYVPWIMGDDVIPNYVLMRFTDCVDYMNRVFRESSVLTYLWQYYVRTFLNRDDYILESCHSCFLKLSWNRFLPSPHDASLMIRVLDSGSSDSIVFLEEIFGQVDWNGLIQGYPIDDQIGLRRLHACFLRLLVKLSVLSKRPETDFGELFSEAETFQWSLLDDADYFEVWDWFCENCDPETVIITKKQERIQIIGLLQASGLFYPQEREDLHPSSAKRCYYLRNYLNLIGMHAVKNPKTIQKNRSHYQDSYLRLFSTTESIINNLPRDMQTKSSSSLLAEIFGILNNFSVVKLQELSLESIVGWIGNGRNSPQMLLAAIRTACNCVASVDHISPITEQCISSLFGDSAIADQDIWPQITGCITIPEIGQGEFLTECSNNGSYLTMYTFIVQEMEKCSKNSQELLGLLASIIKWCSIANPNESNEAKLLLVWYKALELVMMVLRDSSKQNVVVKLLHDFCQQLLKMSEDRESKGFRGSLGLGRKSSLSIRFRTLCRALNAYILAQLPDRNVAGIRLTPNAPGHLRHRTGVATESIQAHHQLSTLKTNKTYEDMKQVIEYSLSFLLDVKNSLTDVNNFLSELCRLLYRDKNYLFTIINS